MIHVCKTLDIAGLEIIKLTCMCIEPNCNFTKGHNDLYTHDKFTASILTLFTMELWVIFIYFNKRCVTITTFEPFDRKQKFPFVVIVSENLR